MTFCFFSLFSDFWSSAILHISSGFENASWLFKRGGGGKTKKKKKTKQKKSQQQKNRNHGFGNLGKAPSLMPYTLEPTAHASSSFSRSGDLDPGHVLLYWWSLGRNLTLLQVGEGLLLSTTPKTLLQGSFLGDFMLLS